MKQDDSQYNLSKFYGAPENKINFIFLGDNY